LGTKKLTYEFVKEQFEQEGYQLISKEYINAHTRLNFICNNNHEHSINWNNFKNGQRCRICSTIKISKKLRHTYEFIKEQFEKEGYILLSKTYHNSNKKLKYRCNNNHISYTSYDNFKAGHRCKKCSFKNRSGFNSHLWKGGVVELNLPLYNTFMHRISWIEEVRRDPDNYNLLQVKCSETNCQKWFTPKRSEVNRRINVLKRYDGGEGRFYCSEECKANCSIYHQKDYPKGFKNNEDTSRIKEWSEMVKERDGYVCKICGSKENLRAHHYESIWFNPIESADLDMGVTLCKKCHIGKAHKDIGCRFIDQTRKSLCREVEKKENN